MSKLENIADMDIRETVVEATKLVHAQAKELAPVDTGQLAGSIHMNTKKTATGYEGRVYTNLEYAMYVEFGTGVKGNGTYPYKIKGLNLSYKDKGWLYFSDKEDKYIFTTGQAAQPFMYPALKMHEKHIKDLLKRGVKDATHGR